MAGLKRKSGTSAPADGKSKVKKVRVDKFAAKSSHKRDLPVRPSKPTKPAKTEDSEELIESDTSEDENGFYGFSASQEVVEDDSDVDMEDAKATKEQKPPARTRYDGDRKSEGPPKDSTLGAMNASSSREAHAKQKALVKERKAAKPNADIIARSKKLWERLRLKSHVEKEERATLVTELFEIVMGRVKDFVFKHDSVRVVQCAVKYGTVEQKKMIARELKGEYKALAESRYAKFLIAKLLENGDTEVRDMIVSEFYGNVRHLMNHVEASWIVDDTYRAVATQKQKARLLREWYGPEFSIKGIAADEPTTADLSVILEESPEKRKPIMDYLGNQINQLIQKKQTAFTMLHDAMLQYFLVCKPGGTEATAFIEHFKPDTTLKEGDEADNADLLKNLAFTKSGSRLMSLVFAYSNAKERKTFLRPYKDHIEAMAYDQYAHNVLLAALAVTDDTRLTSKSILNELLPTGDALPEAVLRLANDVRARTVILYPFAGDAKWLLSEGDTSKRLAELYAIRETTSKKDPNTRLQELARVIVSPLLDVIIARAPEFAQTSFGYQFMAEVLVGAPEVEPAKRKEALSAVADLASQSSDEEPSPAGSRMRMFKTLVQGGKFDPATKKVVPIEPALGFADLFWDRIQGDLEKWATGEGSFVIVGLLESEDFKGKDKVVKALNKMKKALQAAAGSERAPSNGAKDAKGKKNKKEKPQGNAGARILLTKL
jgi:pumilio family protein 6